MKIEEIEKKYIKELKILNDDGLQYEYLMMLGLQNPPVQNLQNTCNRIEGCKTAIWFKADQTRDGMQIFSDSDSLLVKGILAILEEMYTGANKKDVHSHPPKFLDFISNNVIYPEIKKNGIEKCYQILKS